MEIVPVCVPDRPIQLLGKFAFKEASTKILKILASRL